MNSGSRSVGVRSTLEAALETGGSLETGGRLEMADGDLEHETATLIAKTTAHVSDREDRIIDVCRSGIDHQDHV